MDRMRKKVVGLLAACLTIPNSSLASGKAAADTQAGLAESRDCTHTAICKSVQRLTGTVD